MIRKFQLKKDSQKKKWDKLLRRSGYPENMIDSTGKKLENLSDELAEAVIQWEETGELPYIEAEGFTADDLVEHCGMHEIAAVLMIDWLRREPEEAKIALAEPVSKKILDDDTVEIIMKMEEEDSDENL